MPPPVANAVYFGSFLVTPQVFYKTSLSFALVNIKPLLPGHVLISPVRRVPRLHDLTPAEVNDLFQTVQRVSCMLERVFRASALNVAIQDGKDAGQSVPHVHAHVIPRHGGDLDDRGGADKIYEMLEGDEGDVGAHLKEKEQQSQRVDDAAEMRRRGTFPKVDADEERKSRSEKEMREEAEWLAKEMTAEEAMSGGVQAHVDTR